MAKLKFFIDKFGERIYHKTITKAILKEDGTPIGEKLIYGKTTENPPTIPDTTFISGDISETDLVATLPTDDFPDVTNTGKTNVVLGKIVKALSDWKIFKNSISTKLLSDITLYVSTTGSDTTGDGTSSKPFKTIQYVVDSIPKDLGGHIVIINVADGAYPEVVNIIGFTNGEFRLYSSNPELLSDNCKVNQFIVRWNTCLLVIAGFSIKTTTADGIFGDSCTSLHVQFLKITEYALDTKKIGINFYRCIFSVWGCEVSFHEVALWTYNSRGISNGWATCVNNNYGLFSSYGSTITLLGNQPVANTPYAHDSGGSFVYNNGTQISGIYTSGLSCTWGAIQGGYIINGIGGVATVTVVLTVSAYTNLSAGAQYTISGFPRVAGTSVVSVSVHDKQWIRWCHMEINGTLKVTLDSTAAVVAGNWLCFNCTYMTDQQ